jgi:hypothetical protein
LTDHKQATETALSLHENDVRMRTWIRIYFYHSEACFKMKKGTVNRLAKQDSFLRAGP